MKTVGNRKGWRLPTLQELASLIDPSVAAPSLPAGHPFTNVQSSVGDFPPLYWSATTSDANTVNAWTVEFNAFRNVGDVGASSKSNGFFVWCVRGGQGVDPQ